MLRPAQEAPLAEIDQEERSQLLEIRRMMQSPGWTYLMAAWVQLREGKIIGRLKSARSEMPWRYQQGRLDGFDDAVNLAEKLVADVGDMAQPQRSAQEEAEEILKSIRTQ
jgi:hypothetical protein